MFFCCVFDDPKDDPTDSSAGKESSCNAGDPSLISGLGRSPGEGIGYPFQYSGLENSMDCIVESVQFSCSVVSSCLRPRGLQHARPPCPSPTPGVYSNSCPLSRWCHPAISSSVVPFSSHLQFFLASAYSPWGCRVRHNWPTFTSPEAINATDFQVIRKDYGQNQE